jgi:PAS domain S-box-containing protein
MAQARCLTTCAAEIKGVSLLGITCGLCVLPSQLHAAEHLPRLPDHLPAATIFLIILFLAMLIFGRRQTGEEVEDATGDRFDAGQSSFLLLSDHATDMMLITSGQGRILYVNPVTCGLLGYGQRELLGRAAAGFVHPADRQAAFRAIKSAAAGGQEAPREVYLECINHDLLEAEFTAFTMEVEGRGSCVGIVLRDISGQRRREQLSRIEEDWEQTFNSITDFVSVHDSSYRIIKANRALLEYLGRPLEEVIGKTCYHIFHHAEAPAADCPYRKAMENGQPATAEIRGPYIGVPLLVTCSPYYDRQGKFKGTVHVARVAGGQGRPRPAADADDLVPVCASCKDVRQGKDKWISIEDFVHRHYGCRFTHSICPKCQQRLYPEIIS